MPVYVVRCWKGTPRALEHAALIWSKPNEMADLDMIEADAELVHRLHNTLPN